MPAGCFVEKGLIVRAVLGGGIAPVGKQREDEVVVRVGEVVDLQPLDLFAHGGDAGQQRGHDDDRAQIRRDAVAQFQPGQQRRADLLGERAVYDRDGDVRGRNETDDRKDQKRPAASPGMRDGEQRKARTIAVTDGDHAHVAHHADIGAEAAQPGLKRHAAAKVLLEGAAAAGDQIISGVVFGPRAVVLTRGRVACLSGGRDRAVGDVGLAVAGAAREFLDRAAIEIPGREIHRREIAAGAHDRVDRADAFEEFRPIDRRDQAHAGDDVAHRHVHRALALNFLVDDLVGGGSLGAQSVVQPAQRRCRVRIAVAQALRQLHGELRRPWRLLETCQDRGRGLRSAIGRAQYAVAERVDELDLPAAALPISSARRRRFSTSVMRRVIATAHSSPMVSGCTR